MKKFLCSLLAICMLCGAAAFVGCKKDKGGKDQDESSKSSVDFTEDGAPANPDWD